MTEIFLLIMSIGLIWFFGYLVSVLANSIYIDPDEIETIFPTLSERRRHHLEKFTKSPRALFQLALIVRISASIVIGILSLALARELCIWDEIPQEVIYAVTLSLTWFITVLLIIYLPRRTPRERIKRRLVQFLPIISLMYSVGSPIIILFRRAVPARREEISEENKDDIVERAIETLAETAGITGPIVEADEKEMIHQIFQLDVTEAEEIMVSRLDIIGFDEQANLDFISNTVQRYGFSRYPVYKENLDHIIGLLKVKDLLHLSDDERRNFRITNHVRDVLRISEHKKIDQVLADFKKTKTHMAIVIDEFGGTAGLVTLEDILEEIVGDIEDEDDNPHEIQITHLDNGNIEIAGSLSLDELAEELDIELDQDEFETVGGLIYDLAGSVPHEGDSFNWRNCRLRVMEMAGRRIMKILVITNSAI